MRLYTKLLWRFTFFRNDGLYEPRMEPRELLYVQVHYMY